MHSMGEMKEQELEGYKMLHQIPPSVTSYEKIADRAMHQATEMTVCGQEGGIRGVFRVPDHTLLLRPRRTRSS